MLTDSLLPSEQNRGNPAPRGSLAILIGAAAMTILDVSKVGVALPVIQASLGAGAAGEIALQLMMVGYTVAYAVLLLPSGRLGDIVSRKTMFIAGLSAFTLASAACGLAPSAEWLVAGRILQGAGAGLLMPQVVGLIQRLYEPARRGRPLAALAVTTAITSALGPVLAGVIMQLVPGQDSWRWLFWINVVVGVALLPLAIRWIHDVPGERRPGFDVIGALLLTVAVVLTTVPVGALGEDNGPTWMTVVTIGLGVAAGGAFVVHERRRGARSREPLLDLSLFRRAGFGSGLAIAGLMHAAGTSSALITTLFLQQAVGLTPLQTALAMITSAFAVTVSSTLTGRLPVRRAWSLIWVGATVSAGALAAIAVSMATLTGIAVVLACAALLFVNGLGTGMISAPNQSRTLNAVPEYRASIAGSAIQLMQRVGSAFGMAVAMIVYFALGNASSGGSSPGGAAALALCSAFLIATMLIAILDNRPSAHHDGPAR